MNVPTISFADAQSRYDNSLPPDDEPRVSREQKWHLDRQAAIKAREVELALIAELEGESDVP